MSNRSYRSRTHDERDVEARLSHILAQDGDEPERRLRRALRCVVEHVPGLRAGAFFRVTEGTCRAACTYPDDALPASWRSALDDFDSLTAEPGRVVTAADGAPLAHPCSEAPGAPCLGMPLDGASGRFGMLNFFGDPDAVNLERANQLIRLMGTWASAALTPGERSDAPPERTARPSSGEPHDDAQALLTSVLNNFTDGIIALEPVRNENGRVVDFEWLMASPPAADIFGHAEHELVGTRFTQTNPHARETGLFEAYVQVLESGEPYHNEIYHGNAERWFTLTAIPFGDGVTVTFHDVTARKEVEQALRRSEQRYRFLAENATDLIARLHPDDGYTYVSPASRSLLGRAPSELLGQGIDEHVHPDDLMRVRASYGRVLDTGEPGRIAYRWQHTDGHYVWVETVVRGVDPSEDGSDDAGALIAVTRDVAERIEAEAALRRINRQLKQRNQALQDFAYVASHDLQEPLRKVRAFASLLEDEYADAVDDMGRHYMDRVRDAAERMSGLITDLLEFARVTTKDNPFEDVDLGEVLQDVLADLEIAIDETNATLDVGELPVIEADRTQMRQLFQNLVSNALKFAGDDEPPVVRVSAERIEADDATERCRIQVEDNGIGFDEKYLDRIFTPFKRLHGRSAYEGTGMGLAICRRIIDRHDGELAASSTEGEGSTFTVTLPLRRREGRETATQEPVAA